ncbi:hypothetical protein CCB80_02485 [Armatimonadetes bacterium Uphvl-Ar1]|nr:hypothetical protein CCB80_02485 [Armatimonadetes bacterium Uphvl-Ar1]
MVMGSILLGLVVGQTPKVPVGEPKVTARWEIAMKEIDESSGLGASRRSSGVFYTHNDSGDTARFFRFDKKGEVTAVYRLDGVKAIDWEDMEVASVGRKQYVYLADVGDNGRIRPEIYVHRVEEPATDLGNAVLKPETYRFQYPDRKNDCEAVLVDPKTGAIWFVTKARDQKTTVYVCREPRVGGLQVLEKVHEDLKINTGGLGGNLVTGGSVSPDGMMIVLKTYAGGNIYRVTGGFDSWVKSVPIPVQFPLEKQGEAVCFSGDGSFLVSSSEGSPCPIQVFRVPR